MIKNAYINMRVNEALKNDSEKILNDLGLSMSSAIDLFLIQVVNKKGIPFEVVLPSEEETNRKIEFAKSINALGGVEVTPEINKIIHLYAVGDISHEVAIFAIKQEIKKWQINTCRLKVMF